MVTRTDLRLCYYKCLSVRASAVLTFKNGIDRALEYTGSSAKAWWRSPTVFYPSPVDLVAEEQIFGLERNFHKIHGWDCPPLVPDYQVPGTLRLEYYNTSTVSQKVMQGKWDCWATVSLSPRGEVDLQDICKALYVDLEYLTVISPVRWKPFPLDKTRPLTALELHNITYDGQLSIKIIEQNVPRVVQLKRQARVNLIVIWTMLTAILDLLKCRAYDEFEFDVPLPCWFFKIYNLVRTIHPSTRRESGDIPGLEILSTSRGKQHLEYPLSPMERREQEQLGDLLCRPSYSHIFYGYCIVGFLIMWLVTAELVSSLKYATLYAA